MQPRPSTGILALGRPAFAPDECTSLSTELVTFSDGADVLLDEMPAACWGGYAGGAAMPWLLRRALPQCAVLVAEEAAHNLMHYVWAFDEGLCQVVAGPSPCSSPLCASPAARGTAARRARSV